MIIQIVLIVFLLLILLIPRRESFELDKKLTIVTGYFKINRTRAIDYNQGRESIPEDSDGVYREWMKGLLSYNGPMVIFCDAESFDYITGLRKNNPKTVIIKKEIHELYAHKYFHDLNISKDKYTTMVWKEDQNSDINKKLYTVWNSKIDMLKQAVELNSFNTKYYAWYDIGYLREPKSLDINWPNQEKLKILDEKVLFLSVYGKSCQNNDLTTGGFIGCNVNNIYKLHELFYRDLEEKKKNNALLNGDGNDQTLMQKMKCNKTELIDSVEGEDDPEYYPNVEGKWFHMIPFFK